MSAPEGSWFKSARDVARRRWRHKPGLVPWLRALPARLTLRFLRLLPLRLSLGLGDCIGRLAWISEKRKRYGRAQLAQALPQLSKQEADRILKASCGSLGRSAVETLVVCQRYREQGMSKCFSWEPGARELLFSMKGQSPVLVEAHFGAFEAFGAAIAELGLEPGFTMRLPSNYYVAKDVVASRDGFGIQLFPRRGAVRKMLAHMKSGGSIILATDQDAHHAPIFVPWFDKLAATERAASAIALRNGAPVVACWCVREPDVASFRIGAKLVRPAGMREKVTDEAAIDLTSKIHTALEVVIRAHPEQYLWVHNRYKTRPPEE
ncbi:MAG: hypothetical protein MK209_05170 [Planctomycetes bacterium]|nr:hypothetical protein [Planctomycetota bacterium]